MAIFKQLKIIAPIILSRALKKGSPQRKRVNAFLVKQMGENKGLWLKVGQMLSLHPESWEGLEDLPQSQQIPPIDKSEIEPYLKDLFKYHNLDLQLEFPTIKHPGLAASLSQVHEVQSSDGLTWMLKAKLPGIKDVIEDQLSLFGFLQKTEGLQAEKRKFSTEAYQKSMTESFAKELDYEKERLNLKMMQGLQDRFPLFEGPHLHPTIQGDDFIVMERLQGDSWTFVLENYSYEQKQELAEELFRQTLYQYFCRGHCQGDFHPGNFFFKRTPEGIKISWIDLGQCLHPSTTERKALFQAIDCTMTSHNFTLGSVFSAWHFDLNKLGHIAERLPLLLTKLFAPFLSPNSFNVADWHLKKDIDDILGEDRWWFRTAGSPDLFLSIRCWIGLFSMIEILGVPIFYKGLWLELRNEMLEFIPDIPLPEDSIHNISFDDMAKKLHVQVFEDTHEKVSVELPARAINDIEDFISLEVQTEMKRVGINLEELIKNQLKNGLFPGVVLDFKEGQKHYLVTLK
ncbi:MAG: hypothetical protein K9K67_04420 [Bacteriovoracaceae bacterium]|nr:hypothetical protein [Bacteriovoracaceae bacterium]